MIRKLNCFVYNIIVNKKIEQVALNVFNYMVIIINMRIKIIKIYFKKLIKTVKIFKDK